MCRQQGLVIWKTQNKKQILISFLYFNDSAYYYEAQLIKEKISSWQFSRNDDLSAMKLVYKIPVQFKHQWSWMNGKLFKKQLGHRNFLKILFH